MNTGCELASGASGDIVTMALQGHSSEETLTRATKYFDCLYGESVHRAKIMSMAHHNYLQVRRLELPTSNELKNTFSRGKAS